LTVFIFLAWFLGTRPHHVPKVWTEDNAPASEYSAPHSGSRRDPENDLLARMDPGKIAIRDSHDLFGSNGLRARIAMDATPYSSCFGTLIAKHKAPWPTSEFLAFFQIEKPCVRGSRLWHVQNGSSRWICAFCIQNCGLILLRAGLNL